MLKLQSLSRLAAVVTLALSAAMAQTPERPHPRTLPNFHQVDPNVYRGAQPGKDDFQELANLGIKTVVNLRGKGEGVSAEEKEVARNGLRYFNIPFERAGRPRDADIDRVLAIINNPDYQPVFVHCKEGVDRTGTVIAVYRIANHGWTSTEAKEEANRYGMHPWEIGMKNYIHDFYLRHTKAKPS